MDDTIVTIAIATLILLFIVRALRRPAGTPGTDASLSGSMGREAAMPQRQPRADARLFGPWETPDDPAGRDGLVPDPDMPDPRLPDGRVLADVDGGAMIETRPQTPSEATTGQPFRFKTPDEIIKATFGHVTEIPPPRGSGSGGLDPR